MKLLLEAVVLMSLTNYSRKIIKTWAVIYLRSTRQLYQIVLH